MVDNAEVQLRTSKTLSIIREGKEATGDGDTGGERHVVSKVTRRDDKQIRKDEHLEVNLPGTVACVC